jgi:putative ABC transport system permease protein
VGLLASLATGRLIANQLWNTSPHDPLTMAAVATLISVVAVAACYIPARRAMKVDAMAALRHD